MEREVGRRRKELGKDVEGNNGKRMTLIQAGTMAFFLILRDWIGVGNEIPDRPFVVRVRTDMSK